MVDRNIVCSFDRTKNVVDEAGLANRVLANEQHEGLGVCHIPNVNDH